MRCSDVRCSALLVVLFAGESKQSVLNYATWLAPAGALVGQALLVINCFQVSHSTPLKVVLTKTNNDNPSAYCLELSEGKYLSRDMERNMTMCL